MQTTGTRERVTAGAIDIATMAAVVLGVALAPSLRFRGIHFSPAAAFIGAALAMGYTFYELIAGVSPGKLLMGLKITRFDGRPTRYGQLTARWAIKHLPVDAVLLGTSLLWAFTGGADTDGLMILAGLTVLVTAAAMVPLFGYFLIFDGMNRALHDLLAGTGVFPVYPVASVDRAFEALELSEPTVPADDPAASIRPGPTHSRPTGGTDRSAARHATTP